MLTKGSQKVETEMDSPLKVRTMQEWTPVWSQQTPHQLCNKECSLAMGLVMVPQALTLLRQGMC